MKLTEVSKEIRLKLEEADFTLESIVIAQAKDLASTFNIDLEEAKKVIIAAEKELGILPISAAEFLKLEERRGKITTGSNELDSVLGGGIWTQEITELAGGFSSGKTQLCFQLCINVQLSYDEGGLEGKAFFVDTERTFSPKRITEIASCRNLEIDDVLNNIIIAPTLNTNHLFSIIEQLEDIIPKERIKLLVIDSFASHFRSEYIGKEKLVARQQKIMQIAEKLTLLAVRYDIAVLVTNQIIANVEDFLHGSSEEPALGFAWAHRPQQRVFLRKSRGSARIARLFDSSRMPEREALFYVTEAGIADAATRDVYI